MFGSKSEMRTETIDNLKEYRKPRKQILNLEKTIIFDQFTLDLSQQMDMLIIQI